MSAERKSSAHILDLDGVPSAEALAAVDAAMRSRAAVRAFLPKPVPREWIEDLLSVAATAPSGTNTQPWKVHVLVGDSLRAFTQAVLEAAAAPDAAQQFQEEYAYYPSRWVSPYIERRRKVGQDLYALLGISKGDSARMAQQWARNYSFFGAPVGLIFMIDRVLGQGSWLDYGMFLQNVMVAARARGLHTCPQAAFTPFHRVVAQVLGTPADEMLVCGMALGWADPNAPENQLQTEREPLTGFARFHD
jgi:nitroreductase